ncbi:MAG: hypothetical protein ACFBSG_14480 [Leptolyngbyaceae cyanobacterium]
MVITSYWLSWGLLILAYATYGQLLHSTQTDEYIWYVTVGFVIVKAGMLTLFWAPVRDFALRGFQSDVGYSIMVLVLASLAVVAVVQFRAFAYIVVLIAAALLVRVDCLIDGLSDRRSFLTLILLALIGLGISWLPALLFNNVEALANQL